MRSADMSLIYRYVTHLPIAQYSLQRIERKHFFLIINPLNIHEKRVTIKEQCARIY